MNWYKQAQNIEVLGENEHNRPYSRFGHDLCFEGPVCTHRNYSANNANII